MDVLTKIAAESENKEWIEMHWIAHEDHISEYLLIRDLFLAWEPEQYAVSIRDIEMSFSGGMESMFLGEWYGQKSLTTS